MTSNTQIERMAEYDMNQLGMFQQPAFKCPKCGARSTRGTKDRKTCYECYLWAKFKRPRTHR